jgi:DNA repair exonuclease SbcCD nuclease subunit
MKFAIIADIHLSRYSQDKIEDETHLPERLHSIKNALYEVGNYCHENDIKMIIIAGDIYHNKSIIYAIGQDIMLDFFEKYEDLEFWVLDGNHDLSGKGADAISALRPIMNCTNVEWITQSPVGNEDFVCIPYSHDVVSQVKTNKRKILISHFGLDEGILSSGISIVADIKTSDLIGKYDLVLLGHYHKPQEIIRDDIKIYYVGSLIQLDWGEKNEEKRFLVVDTDTLDVQEVPITGYKKHIEIELTDENKDEVFVLAQQEKDAGNHIKIIMKEKVDIDGIKHNFNIIDKTEQDITDRGITSSMSQEDKVKKYLEIKKIPENKKDEYAKIAFELMQSEET